MDKDIFSAFEYWQQQKHDNFPDIIATSENVDRIDKETIFLWAYMVSPMPSSVSVGIWELVPDYETLKGYLRFIRLPGFFEIWLDRAEWDDSYNELILAEELFTRAEAVNGLDNREDISFMKDIIQELDSINNDLTTAHKIEQLKGVLGRFNDRWNSTLTWSFGIYIYQDAVEAGKQLFSSKTELINEIFKHNFKQGQTVERENVKEQWLAICQNVYNDRNSCALFMEVMNKSNDF